MAQHKSGMSKLLAALLVCLFLFAYLIPSACHEVSLPDCFSSEVVAASHHHADDGHHHPCEQHDACLEHHANQFNTATARSVLAAPAVLSLDFFWIPVAPDQPLPSLARKPPARTTTSLFLSKTRLLC
jgi:ABC-type nickel/cobalt efflux system permease component RcnA